jgi:hypothetical protein
MAFSISGITGYIDETSFELISKAVLGTNLGSYTDVRVGLKGKSVDIPLLDTDFVVGSGDACGYSNTETTTISQVNMNLFNAKINATFCVQSLRDTFMSKALAAGALNGGQSLPMEQLYANFFVEKLQNYNERFLIAGAAEGSQTVNGLYQQASASANTYIGGGTGTITGSNTAWTLANAVSQSQDMYTKLPDTVSMADDLILIVSPTDYKTLSLATTQANYYHIAPDINQVFIPGTNVRVVASAGIPYASGNSFKLLTRASNIIVGTDLTGDFEQFKLWYSQDNDEMRSLMRWIIGVTMIQPELAVTVFHNTTSITRL